MKLTSSCTVTFVYKNQEYVLHPRFKIYFYDWILATNLKLYETYEEKKPKVNLLFLILKISRNFRENYENTLFNI